MFECEVIGRGGRTTENGRPPNHYEDLHMRKICAKLVPKNLSNEQKDNRVLNFMVTPCIKQC